MKSIILFYKKVFTSIDNIIDIRHRNYLNRAIKNKIRYFYLRTLLISAYNKSIFEIKKKRDINPKLIDSIQLYEFDNLRNEYEEYIKKIKYLKIKMNGKINHKCYKPFAINEVFLYNPEKNRYESMKNKNNPFSMVFINLKEFDMPKTFNNNINLTWDLKDISLSKHNNTLYYTRLYRSFNKFDIKTIVNILKYIYNTSTAFILYEESERMRRLRRISAEIRYLARHYKTLLYSEDKKEFDEKIKKFIIYNFFKANFYDHCYIK